MDDTQRKLEGQDAAQTGSTQGTRVGGSQVSTEVGAGATGLSRTVEEREIVERLRLHEERATVEVLREGAGVVQVRRVTTERQETVPITLHREHLEITVTQDQGGLVKMNGEVLEVGRTYEVPLYDERAIVQKQVYPLSDVVISKGVRDYVRTEEITLRREELVVEDPQGLVRDRAMPAPLGVDAQGVQANQASSDQQTK